MKILKTVLEYWKKLGEVLAWINTRIILTAIFFLVITPIGWWLRITRKDWLSLKRDQRANSYWLPTKKTVREQLLKQY
jgi:hypothetical protein